MLRRRHARRRPRVTDRRRVPPAPCCAPVDGGSRDPGPTLAAGEPDAGPPVARLTLSPPKAGSRLRRFSLRRDAIFPATHAFA